MTLLVDAGPLIALLHRDDQHHSWAKEAARSLPISWHTCEAVVVEAYFKLLRVRHGPEKLAAILAKDELLLLDWHLSDHRKPVLELLSRYRSLPVSVADACLIRMAETAVEPMIWTTDSHFHVYRIHRNRKIPLLTPFQAGRK
jgi:predicted nucleic acid-binding protein